MSDAAHTPGPWRVVPHWETQGWGYCVAAGKEIILSVRGAKRPQEQKRADVTLCAAAPDLLAACERFARAMEMCRHPDPRLDPRLPARMLAEAEVLAREALDAAKGATG